MKTIIHDLPPAVFEELFPETALLSRLGTSSPSAVVLSAMYPARPCIGCFGCWVKTPGICVLPDSYQDMGKIFSKTSELILISRCFYGSYSPYVKNVLDRSIGYLQPFFRILDGEMHHTMRYDNHMAVTAYFYGDSITAQEEKTAADLVHANGVNLGASQSTVSFCRTPEEIRGDLS